MNPLTSALASACLVACALAQGHPVGTRTVAWPNTSGVGSHVIDATVHYPAAPDGSCPPAGEKGEGWPVVVFLHGYSQLGSDYHALGEHLAESGFVAVMIDTGQYHWPTLEADARAMFTVLTGANRAVGGPFHDRLDMSRVGLMGHSMGGGAAAYVLADDPAQGLSNPGYRCGLALTPVDPGPIASSVHVPFGVVSGDGDLITPPLVHASPYYEALAPQSGIKFHYHLGLAADHMNVAGLWPNAPDVFDRTCRVAVGFIGHFAGRDVAGLEAVLGADGIGDANLMELVSETITPQSWVDRPLRVGTVTRISVSSEVGYGGVLAAAATSAPTPTWIGTLLLDPHSVWTFAEGLVPGNRFDAIVNVPAIPALAGMAIAFQGAAANTVTPLTLGTAMSFEIRP